MKTYNNHNTEDVKASRKKSKELRKLRKLRMNSGYTLAWDDEDDKLKVAKFNYNDYYSSLNQEFDEVI